MTDPNKQPYQYSAGDLARYASGEMSREEMHRLEKAALDDPFLAEALEGLMVSGGDEAWKDLGELRERLSWELGQRKPESAASPDTGKTAGTESDERNADGEGGLIVPIDPDQSADHSRETGGGALHPGTFRDGADGRAPWFSRGYRVAAAVALLIGLGLVTNWYFQQSAEPASAIVKTETQTEQASTPVPGPTVSPLQATDSTGSANSSPKAGGDAAESAVSALSKPAPVDVSDPNNPAGKKGQPAAAEPPTARVSPSLPVQREPTAAAASERKEAPVAAAPVPRPAATDPAHADADKAFMGKARTAAPPSKGAGSVSGPFVFSGDIVDPEGKPLSFVNIRMESGQGTYYSDAKGHFRILSADTGMRLVFKAYGFQSKPVSLSARDGNTRVQLMPGKDIAKTKAALRPKASSAEEMETLDMEADTTEHFSPAAEPRDGWAAYQLYLLNNLRMPQDAARAKLHGTVDLSFLVDPNGRLTDFRVEKSLSPACDKEAIRLVREGPAWELFNAETALRGRVTVVF